MPSNRKRNDPARTVVQGNGGFTMSIAATTSSVTLTSSALLASATRLVALSDLWKNFAFTRLRLTVIGDSISRTGATTLTSSGRSYCLGYLAGTTSATSTTITYRQASELAKMVMWMPWAVSDYGALASQALGVKTLYPIKPLLLNPKELIMDQPLKRFKIGTDEQFTLVFASITAPETNITLNIEVRLDYVCEFTEPASTALVPLVRHLAESKEDEEQSEEVVIVKTKRKI